MNNRLHSDLKYWAKKWVDAETKIIGPEKVDTINLCKLMTDRFLDKVLEDKKLGIESLDEVLQEK